MPLCLLRNPNRPEFQCGREVGHLSTGLSHGSYLECCPVAGCEDRRRPYQMMCRRHWFRVPKDVRDRVWRTVKKLGKDYMDARVEAILAATLWQPKIRGKSVAGLQKL